MDDETRQPRTEEDYMQMMIAALGVNTPREVWEWVENQKNTTALVIVDKNNKVVYAKGLRVGVWLAISQAINKMVEEATI